MRKGYKMEIKKITSSVRTKSGALKKTAVKKAVRSVSKTTGAKATIKGKDLPRRQLKSVETYVYTEPPKGSKTIKTSTSPSRTKSGKLRKSVVREAVELISKSHTIQKMNK